MGKNIVQRTINSVDTKLLSIGAMGISIPIEGEWSSITLGILGGLYSESHRNLSSVGSNFKMGLFDSPESVVADNSSINHFVGMELEGAIDYDATYNDYKNSSSGPEMKMRILQNGSSAYYQDFGLGRYFGAIPNKKLALFLQIEKGASFYNFRFFRSNSTSTPSTDFDDFLINMQSDFPISIFGGMYDTPLNDSYGYAYGDSRASSVDEATYGSLNTFGVLWGKSDPVLEIEKMSYCKIV
jgi:hypothetical protein